MTADLFDLSAAPAARVHDFAPAATPDPEPPAEPAVLPPAAPAPEPVAPNVSYEALRLAFVTPAAGVVAVELKATYQDVEAAARLGDLESVRQDILADARRQWDATPAARQADRAAAGASLRDTLRSALRDRAARLNVRARQLLRELLLDWQDALMEALEAQETALALCRDDLGAFGDLPDSGPAAPASAAAELPGHLAPFAHRHGEVAYPRW